MASVDYAYPVEALHGKVNRRHTVGFAQRQDTGRKFTQTHGKRTTDITAAEQELRNLFATAVRATYTRMADPAQSVTDKAAFAKQTKYKTLYGYVFSQVYGK